MRKLLVILLLLVACSGWCDTPVQDDQNNGFIAVATESFTVNSLTKVNIGALLPSGTKTFQLTTFNGAIVVNHEDDLATGTIYCGEQIASGSTGYYTGVDPDNPTTFRMHALANIAATCTVKLKCQGR